MYRLRYHYQGAEYEVQIDKVVRSAATHSGIMQFTVNRVSGKGEPWYTLTGGVLPEYDYWTMETRNLQEINPTDHRRMAGDGAGKFRTGKS